MDGKVVKKAIMDRGLSMAEVSRRLGMLQQTFSSAINGKNLKTGFVEKVAAVIGVDVAYFYTGIEPPKIEIPTPASSDEAYKILHDQLAEKDRQIDRLLDIIKQIFNNEKIAL